MRIVIMSCTLVALLRPCISQASDISNDCRLNENPTSANIQFPADDAYHYPGQWGGASNKLSVQTATDPFPDTAIETTYKAWHWSSAHAAGSGQPSALHAWRFYAAIRTPAPPIPTADGWIRLLAFGMVGPDGVNHHYVYLAPGKFAARDNGFTNTIGGTGESIVYELSESGSIVTLSDPTVPVGHAEGAGGSALLDDFKSTDELIELHTTEESTKRANYPALDGYSPAFRYYWARSWLSSSGTVTYGGVTYDVSGTAWEERQWQLSLDQMVATTRWRWVSFQILGCLNSAGKPHPCDQTGRTIAAWDDRHLDGSYYVHFLNEVAPPPGCAENDLSQDNQWTLTPTGYWTSPHTGINYATGATLTTADGRLNLTATYLQPDNELYKARFVLPGFAEGAGIATGTIDGVQIWGYSMMEHWNLMP